MRPPQGRTPPHRPAGRDWQRASRRGGRRCGDLTPLPGVVAWNLYGGATKSPFRSDFMVFWGGERWV